MIISLQMIHFITMALGGDGYLNFMGNEVNNYFIIILLNLMSDNIIKICRVLYQRFAFLEG